MEVGERSVQMRVNRGIKMAHNRIPRDTYNYTLTGRHGEDLYHGITNNPERREAQHRASGRRFVNLVCDPFPCPRDTALRRERDRIETYKRNQGRKPKYNRVF